MPDLPPLPPLGPGAVDEFTRTIYGRTPPGGELAGLVLQSREDGVLDGTADRLRHRATITCPLGDLEFDTLLHLPTSGNARVVVILNFDGNDQTLTDWPYEKIIHAGYAVLTAQYGQIEPDDPNPPAPGVRGLFPSESWGAVAAWAWGLSRLLDIASTIDRIDPAGAMVIGHSRLGKAALWAGVQDERFALTVSNDSGCCGASLFRHPGGEDIEAITRRFPHWFVPSFAQYAGKEDELPVDQHQLLASIAPRRVYVCSAEDDAWADPVGEYLAVEAARPAFGADGIGYHLRPGGHALLEEDWMQALAF
ncbi:acetylxylan esterase [Kribbella sp.]|uniref:glucuronyl esterase domain-containing protein n=1 Tax=Kribbella sp. TaxID=1871183 RepID=UPI002D5B9C3E|nr:acetylxylan esterase [Kribbella sp.]HZX05592.1 acetylxylan esterase [Kribbella sp.]